MNFSVHPEIFQKFPTLSLGVLVCKNLKNKEIDTSKILSAIAEQEEKIRANFTPENFSEHPKFWAWKEAYSVFGGKPKSNKCSIENLYRMVLSGRNIRSVNPLVDAYNLVSLENILPLGGEDLDAMEGDLELTFAGENEPAVLLLGDSEANAPKMGEVIYKDSISAVCRRWNWREADRTKLTEKTTNCVLVVEGIAPATPEEVKSATQKLQSLVQEYCGGEISTFFLDAETQNISF